MNNSVRAILISPVLGLLLLGAGCTGYYGDSRSRQMTDEREDMLLLHEQIQRLEGRLEGIEMQNEGLRDEWEYTQRDQSRTTKDGLYSLRNRLDELERRLGSLEANRERDKQEIIETLTGTISTLIKKSGPSSTQTRRRAPLSGTGYEHAVESGQTLSEIAAAYDVSVASIIDANDLADPNALRVGQILFIPE